MKIRHTIIISISALLVSSCGTGFLKPSPGRSVLDEIEIPGSYQHTSDDSIQTGNLIRWWKTFGDPGIDHLVDEVLRNNLDIMKANAAVLEIRARAAQAGADRLPAILLKGDYQKQHMPEVSSPFGLSGGGDTETYNLSAAASFELDLWGKMSMAHEAARADLLSSIENRNTIIQTIVSEAISLYLLIDTREKRIQISEQTISSHKKNVSIVRNRYNKGLTSILELEQSQRNLAQAESNLPVLQQELGISQQRLSLLAGKYPETHTLRKYPEDYFLRLSPVPAGLPSKLIENRPDIRAAAARLNAAAARVGVAKTSLFPRITMTGNYGHTSSELQNLFKPGNVLWNLVSGITQPVFNSGKLIAEKNAAWARYHQSSANYAKTVLNAFSEVEGALLTRKRQMERREKTIEFLKKAKTTLQIAESRYQRGLISYIIVLDAMRAWFMAQENLVLVDLAILTNRVTLHRALGGNWIETKD